MMRIYRSRFTSGLLAGLFVFSLTVVSSLAQDAATDGETHGHGQGSGRVILLAREAEVRLAINALPRELRDGATVLVVQQQGYQKARQGTNPFTSIVSRRGGNFYPVCFDREGTRIILKLFPDDAVMRMKGQPDEEIERYIADGFVQGRYQHPSRPGIAYMPSPATYMLNNGKLVRTPPHTLFYAPFLTNADIGGVMGNTVIVDRPGPHGMIIVLAGQKEREALLAESQPLVDKVERQTGWK